MKSWFFCFVLIMISINGRGDIMQSEKIPIRVNPEKTAEAQMLFSDPKFYLGRIRFFPGGAVPEHTHSASMEIVYVLSGSGELTIDGRKSNVKAGDVVSIPVGIKHSFRNSRTEPAEFIQVYSPPGPEERFKGWTIKK